MRRVATAGLGFVYFLSNGAIAFAEEASEVHKTRFEDLDFLAIFLNWFPMLLLIGVWLFFMRSFTFLNSRKGVVTVQDVHKRSIAWMDKTEKLLEEIVQIQKQK